MGIEPTTRCPKCEQQGLERLPNDHGMICVKCGFNIKGGVIYTLKDTPAIEDKKDVKPSR